MSPEIVVSIVVGLLTIGGVLVIVGRERQKLDEQGKDIDTLTKKIDNVELESRKIAILDKDLTELKSSHNGIAKEARERLSSVEHRQTDTEKWQAGVDANLIGINEKLFDVKTTLVQLVGPVRRKR